MNRVELFLSLLDEALLHVDGVLLGEVRVMSKGDGRVHVSKVSANQEQSFDIEEEMDRVIDEEESELIYEAMNEYQKILQS